MKQEALCEMQGVDGYILLVNDIYNLKSVKFEMLWIKIITGEIGL